MTQKFNAGDKVRCISAFGLLRYGAEYTIRAVDGDYVYMDPDDGGWFASRFQLTKPAPTPPKPRFVLIYPNGVIDTDTFDTEADAVAAGEDAFDSFSVAQLVTVATYTVETTTNLVRKAA